MKKLKILTACLLAAGLSIPAGQVLADENRLDDQTQTSSLSGQTQETDTTEETDEDADSSDYTVRDEMEVLKSMTLAAENDNMALYYTDKEDLLALEYKNTGYIWWSSPINAQADPNAKTLVKKQLESTMSVTYGDTKARTTGTLRSAKNAKMIFDTIDNGIRITYRYPSCGFTVPVEYTLEEDCLKAQIHTDQIVEKKIDETDAKLIIEISVLPNITAADNNTDGYYIIPDGMGALINFNNGKTNAKEYSSRIYGDDITTVPLTSSSVTQQVYLPVYGTVVGDKNAMLAVISDGDSNAMLKASVSGLSKSSYNTCWASFILRTTDTYYMSSKPLTVFEKGNFKTDQLCVSFYPVSDKNGTDYNTVAGAYRDYLIQNGVSPKQTDTALYLNLLGGVRKKQSVLGIPVEKSIAATGYSQAADIISELNQSGCSNIVAVYDNWTDDGICNKVDTDCKPSGILGGKHEYGKMLSEFSENGVKLYPAVNNKTFRNGNGYWTFSDTAMRASGQYSRQMGYNLAYGTQDTMKKPVSLLSPSDFPAVFEKLCRNYSSSPADGICIGEMTSVLYGDYSKKSSSRDQSMNYISHGLESLQTAAGSVLARTANAYAVRYADHITGVPLSSSRYDIFDAEIPFYQIALHGLIPYSAESVNASADSEKLFLMCAATGSNISYDLLDCDIDKLKDTEYDKYFYASSGSWTDIITGEYRMICDVFSDLNDRYIIQYKQDDDVITTVFSDYTKITTDLSKGEITKNGRVYRLSDYIDMTGEVMS